MENILGVDNMLGEILALLFFGPLVLFGGFVLVALLGVLVGAMLD